MLSLCLCLFKPELNMKVNIDFASLDVKVSINIYRLYVEVHNTRPAKSEDSKDRLIHLISAKACACL